MSRPGNGSCPRNEQAVGFVLHTLEPDEEIEVLRHLPQCPSCRAVVQDAEAVFTRMGAAVEQIDPPPALRSSLMAEVAQTPQVPQRPSPTPPAQSPPVERSPASAPTTPPTAPRGPGSRRAGPLSRSGPSGPPSRRSWLSRNGRRLAAAAVVLIGVVAIGGLGIRTLQLQQERDAELAQSSSMSELLERLGRPGTTYALLGPEGGPTTAAVVVAAGERLVYPFSLPANADSDIYVLWGLGAAGNPQPLGTFDVVPADPGLREVGTDGAADDFAQYAISIEPGRAAPAVPTKVVAIGEVTA